VRNTLLEKGSQDRGLLRYLSGLAGAHLHAREGHPRNQQRRTPTKMSSLNIFLKETAAWGCGEGVRGTVSDYSVTEFFAILRKRRTRGWN